MAEKSGQRVNGSIRSQREQSPLKADLAKVQQRASAMDAQTQQLQNRQKELQESLAQMQRRLAITAHQYQQQLSDLAVQQKQAMAQANARLETMHAQQMAEIESKYRRARNEMTRHIQERLHQLEELQQQAIQQQNARISAMESRLDAEDAQSKAIADRSFAEMQDRWQTLRQREELAAFVRPHQAAYDVAAQNINVIYQQRQYQAVTGIAVNSSALIQGWQVEAEASYAEKLELIGLCQAQLDYMTSRLDTAAQRDDVACDGVSTRVVMERYAPAEFQQLRIRRDTAAEQLATANAMTLTQMRALLTQLEGCRGDVDQTYRQAWLRHRGCLRRQRCQRTITAGMRSLKFGVARTTFCHGDFLRGIILLLQNEYSGNRLIIRITTPDLESGQTNCQVTLYTSDLMDAGGKRALCETFGWKIHNLLAGMNSSGTADVQMGRAYRSERGAWCSDLTVQI